ncbi:TrkH family potassium uptake protein [Selenomonas sp. TAMA-11512]|uniref:potassium transporter TrkG n=1 Tax=Selenomonas sp. TAMA-11512 TaxID=3095337 RepID=UPI00308D0114|nr:TrkH family potassium uptake protein [Selenomonas sp. TAMA-11512]
MIVNLFLLACLSLTFGFFLLGGAVYADLSGMPRAPYLIPAVLALAVALPLPLLRRRVRRNVSLVEGAFFLPFSWLYLTVIGLLPFYLTGVADPTDAFLAAASALSTTMPLYAHEEIDALLFSYQVFLGWFGGLHFLVLLFTILPVVGGCFGVSLTAGGEETYSPLLTRMRTKGLNAMVLYTLWTVISILAYAAAGASPEDAVAAGLSTVSTLGFGTDGGYAASVVGMPFIMLLSILSGTSNLLWQRALEKRSWRMVVGDGEFLYYLRVASISAALMAFAFWLRGGEAPLEAMGSGAFYAVSFLTTSGSLLESSPNFASTINFGLLLLTFIGCSIGSAGGGFSPIRLRILLRAVRAEVRRTLHPRMVVTISAGDYDVPNRILGRILIFFFLYFGTFALGAVVLSLAGLGAMPAIALTAGCLTSTGTLYTLFAGSSFFTLPLWTKMTACLLMLLGRLEIFACLVLVGASVGRAATGKWKD